MDASLPLTHTTLGIRHVPCHTKVQIEIGGAANTQACIAGSQRYVSYPSLELRWKQSSMAATNTTKLRQSSSSFARLGFTCSGSRSWVLDSCSSAYHDRLTASDRGFSVTPGRGGSSARVPKVAGSTAHCPPLVDLHTLFSCGGCSPHSTDYEAAGRCALPNPLW